MTMYFAAAVFYILGVFCGYVGASILSMHNESIMRVKRTLDNTSSTRLYEMTPDSEDDSEV